MGLFDIGKPKITTEQWLRFALDQLFSSKWEQTQKKLYVWTTDMNMTELSEQSFIDEIFGAQVVLFAVVCFAVDYRLGMDASYFIDEYIKKLPAERQRTIRDAYQYSNKKVGSNSNAHPCSLIAIACAERLNMKSYPSFIQQINDEFIALGEKWRADAGKYKFIST